MFDGMGKTLDETAPGGARVRKGDPQTGRADVHPRTPNIVRIALYTPDSQQIIFRPTSFLVGEHFRTKSDFSGLSQLRNASKTVLNAPQSSGNILDRPGMLGNH